jgi:L-ascorbate metabolism protein UlaG (beta-lactamase superfamily)
MTITLDWLGCATFRLTIDNLVIFLDAYMDRPPTAPAVGLTTAGVDRADFILVGHSHFDHLAGAEVIAAKTGARIIGSNESCRVMRECGVPSGQLLPSQGGEHHRLNDTVTVRVYPSLHSCVWSGFSMDLGEERHGDVGLCEHERAERLAARGIGALGGEPGSDRARIAIEHLRGTTGSRVDGGTLVYLIETPSGTIFYQDTSGCWTGVMSSLRADVAILALAARANVDGEPYQGSLARFVAQEVEWLGAQTVVLGHHDNWFGLMDRDVLDVAPVRAELGRLKPPPQLLEHGYLAATPLLA